MIDSLRAIFRRHCPWCEEAPLSLWERFLDRAPMFVVKLDLLLGQSWRIGHWWHWRFHETKYEA